MIQHNIIEDLSILTTIPQSSLNQLARKEIYCICDCVEEAVLSGDNLLSVKTGVGTIKLELGDSEINYRFEPSKELEDGITNTVINKKNLLIEVAEEKLVKRITNAYKDFL